MCLTMSGVMDESGNKCFFSSVSSVVNQEDLEVILKEQKSMLKGMEKSNQMLFNCNNVAERQQQTMLSQIHQHTVLLQEMQKDLHSVYTRIRRLKATLQERNPEAWLVIESDDNPSSSTPDLAAS